MVNLKNCLTAGVLLYGAVFALYGNSLIGGTTPNGGTFADDRVIAGSVNLGVQF